jgi:cyclopropane-fatty-acyl-phospholipid synthase
MSLVYAPEEKDQLTISCASVAELAHDNDNGRSIATSWQRAVDARCLFRRAVLNQFAKLQFGQMTVVDRSGAFEFGQVGQRGPAATINVHNRRFYRDVVLGGSLGAAESYIRGDFDSPDLIAVMRVLAQNTEILTGMEQGVARLFRPLRAAANWLRRNTPAGSKRNIAAHYDLSNDFFSLMLDPTMTYSSGVFLSREATLEEASIEKYDRICRKLQLTPADHILESGTGWGGFAEHAVKNYGCRVTTTTISDAQHAYAARRFRESGIDHRITLLKQDYRDLRGKFDKLVSIEMIEAVGEKFLPGYFAKCSDLLKPDGMMCLQSITIPDHRYDRYRKSVDFIQRYIFPGGFLPSMSAIGDCLGRATDFRLFHVEDFGNHYGDTLAQWRRRFWKEIDEVKALGFDERFIRTWHYYLCYCEAGFRERQIGVAQLTLTKPACRREPILSGV